MEFIPQVIHNVFDEERFKAIKNICKQLIDDSIKEPGTRIFIDGRHVKIISDLAIETLPLAENIFNCKLKYMHSALVEYEGEFARLGKHKDHAENLKLLDIAISQDFKWPISVNNIDYIFDENCALAFESGKLMHERLETIKMRNKKVSMLLLYYAEIDSK
jgi:hypothetical protein